MYLKNCIRIYLISKGKVGQLSMQFTSKHLNQKSASHYYFGYFVTRDPDGFRRAVKNFKNRPAEQSSVIIECDAKEICLNFGLKYRRPLVHRFKTLVYYADTLIVFKLHVFNLRD